MKHRFRWIIITIMVCVVLLAVTFTLGRLVRSPNEKAVTNSNYVPQVTAQVELRSVNATKAEVRGELALGTSWKVTVEASDGDLPIVTETHLNAGETLHSGQLLAEVSGRPVIALQLPFKLYRNINGGNSGDDIEKLQHSLQDLGLYQSEIDGVYGEVTAQAIEDLYAHTNTTKPAPEGSTLENATAAQDALDKAKAVAKTKPGDKEATAAVASAEKQLSEKKILALTPVLRSEIVSLPSLQATVVSISPINTDLGTDTPLAELRSGTAVVTARIGMGDKDTFAVGTKVEVHSAADAKVVVPGTIKNMGPFTQESSTTGNDVPGYDINVELTDPRGMDDGGSVVLVAGSGEKIEGIAVPITALRKDGKDTFVVKPGSETRVSVKIKTVNDGYAILDGSPLSVGEKVIVSQS